MVRELQQKRSQGGFTIIEVLIVLAIAGLIMVVVFLAIPNLQKSQRNNSRKTDGNNTLSALSDFVSNNGGTLPASCTGSAGCTWMPKLGYFDASGTNVKFINDSSAFTAPAVPTSEQLDIISGATCGGGAASAPTAGTPRQIAAYYGIEGSVSTQCISE